MVSQQDTRRLSPEQQEILRKRAVEAVFNGEKQVIVARMLGVSAWSVSQWVNKAKRFGKPALTSKRRGGGKKRLLTKTQENWVRQKIADKNPEQLKLPFVLWTREAIQTLAEQRFGIRLALRTITDYLRRWGMTPQRPLKRAYEQDPEAVKAWEEEVYPQVQAKAKAEKAVIYWGDEMGLQSTHQAGKSFSPQGKTPVVETTGKRFRCNMISAITNLGRMAFSLFEGNFVIPVFLDFLQRLVRHAQGRKVLLIIDSHPVHKAKAVQAWLEEHSEQIEVFFLPGYSPHLNPDEFLNQDVKATVFKTKRPRHKKDLKTLLKARLYAIQKQPQRIRAYFQAPSVRYAAA